MKGKSYTWVIQGDINKCFDRIPHKIVIQSLKEYIEDPGFLNLIRKFLKTGYINPKTGETVAVNHVGIPQGGILSPILCNIVLHKFDDFMREYIQEFESGKRRKGNPEYRKLEYRRRTAKTFKERLNLLRLMRKISAYDMNDPNFKRMMYIRYADDFVVLVTGSKNDATLTKIRIKDALQRLCGAELNNDKTLITNMKDGFDFLGSHIRKLGRNPQFIGKDGRAGINRVYEGRLLLNVPILKIISNLEKMGMLKRENSTGKRTPSGCK